MNILQLTRYMACWVPLYHLCAHARAAGTHSLNAFAYCMEEEKTHTTRATCPTWTSPSHRQRDAATCQRMLRGRENCGPTITDIRTVLDWILYKQIQTPNSLYLWVMGDSVLFLALQKQNAHRKTRWRLSQQQGSSHLLGEVPHIFSPPSYSWGL